MMPRWLRAGLVVLVALVLHTSVFPQLRIADVRPDVMLLLAVLGGLAAGPQVGAIFGFACGLAADLLAQTPVGLAALTFSLVGYGVGTFQGVLLRSAVWLTPAVAAAASAVGVAVFVLAGAVLGQSQLITSSTLAVIGLVAVFNAVFALPASRVVAWALRPDESR